MPSLYARWMYDWETRLTSVDNNRVVRPLEWGIEWTREWPCRNGFMPARTDEECEHYLREYNARAVASSDEFFSYKTPSDFRLERREVKVFSTREIPDTRLEVTVSGTHADFLRFTSPVRTPYPENNLANARWFPAKGRSAVVLLPLSNSEPARHFGSTAEHAASRYSPSPRDPPCRLCRLRQHRPHHRCSAPGRSRSALLS